MYKVLVFLALFFIANLSFASPTSLVDTPSFASRDVQPSISFASVITTAKTQLDTIILPLESEDVVPSETDIIQCLGNVTQTLSAATTSLQQLSSQPDATIHAAYVNSQISLKKQLSDARIARSFASLIYTLRLPMQAGVSSSSSAVSTAFKTAAAATGSLISTSNTVIPGMSGLVRPLVRPLLPMFTALDIDL